MEDKKRDSQKKLIILLLLIVVATVGGVLIYSLLTKNKNSNTFSKKDVPVTFRYPKTWQIGDISGSDSSRPDRAIINLKIPDAEKDQTQISVNYTTLNPSDLISEQSIKNTPESDAVGATIKKVTINGASCLRLFNIPTGGSGSVGDKNHEVGLTLSCVKDNKSFGVLYVSFNSNKSENELRFIKEFNEIVESLKLK